MYNYISISDNIHYKLSYVPALRIRIIFMRDPDPQIQHDGNPDMESTLFGKDISSTQTGMRKVVDYKNTIAFYVGFIVE